MLRICSDSPIVLSSGFALEIPKLRESIASTNTRFVELKRRTEAMALNIFETIDFRMLSGLVGGTLITAIAAQIDGLMKNPNIDGYPDLADVSKKTFLKDFLEWEKNDFRKFIKYPHGGIEIKNTFGTKKSNVVLHPLSKRMGKINGKPDWKAHHRYTNQLLAVMSDFVGGCPQIIAVLYSDQLQETDWAEKQNPKKGSAMTSFSVIKTSGWLKLRSGLRICRDDAEYFKYFGFSP
jgi:hypothetical protein